jgi:hypothetical protein
MPVYLHDRCCCALDSCRDPAGEFLEDGRHAVTITGRPHFLDPPNG